MRRVETKVGRSTWHLARTFSSHQLGRDENVLKCFLLTELKNDFDTYENG